MERLHPYILRCDENDTYTKHNTLPDVTPATASSWTLRKTQLHTLHDTHRKFWSLQQWINCELKFIIFQKYVYQHDYKN